MSLQKQTKLKLRQLDKFLKAQEKILSTSLFLFNRETLRLTSETLNKCILQLEAEGKIHIRTNLKDSRTFFVFYISPKTDK